MKTLAVHAAHTQERRSLPRASFPRTATVQRGSEEQPVVLRDFSLAGLRVDLRGQRSLGSRYRFVLQDRDRDARVVLESIVCRVDPDGGAYLQFADVDTDAFRALGHVFAGLR